MVCDEAANSIGVQFAVFSKHDGHADILAQRGVLSR